MGFSPAKPDSFPQALLLAEREVSTTGGCWVAAVHGRNVHSGAVMSYMPLEVMVPINWVPSGGNVRGLGGQGRESHNIAFHRQIGAKRP